MGSWLGSTPSICWWGKVTVELKVARALTEVHAAQCINYLKATGLRVCLLFNFAKPRLEIRRFKDGT